MNELQRRVVAAAPAEMLGRGGKSAVAKASEMSRNTVIKAEREVHAGIEPTERLRAVGGGDKPAISVGAKKKELIGDFQNGGTKWQPKGEPERVRVHDFIDEELGKAIP